MLAQSGFPVRNARVGILGFAFKENVPDIRNSKVVDIYRELKAFGVEPLVHDPLADASTAFEYYQVGLSELEHMRDLDALILAVPHDQYAELDPSRLSAMIVPNGIFIDIKAKVEPGAMRDDIQVWSL